MRLRWGVVLHSKLIGCNNMALGKLPKLGAMRAKMIKAKTAPSIKLGDLKGTIGPKRPAMTRNLTSKPISRGEMI